MATTTANLGLSKPAATDAPDIDVINVNMDKIDTAVAGKADKRENGYSYTQLASYYSGNNTPTYIRIAIPKRSSIWTMCTLEISLKQDWSSAYFGKILIHGNWSSSSEWNQLCATVHGRLSNDIKIYASDKTYIYIKGCRSYCTCTVDKMLIGDNAINYDLSGVTIDSVSSLPSTYQTANMIYDVNSENIGSQSVNNAATATKAISVIDYGDTSRAISIGFAGTSLNPSNANYLAAFTENGTKIKDLPFDSLKTILGLGSAAYTSSDDYLYADAGPEITG